MLRLLPVCLLVAPLAATAAEPELRLPDDAWESRFQGLHAVDGACEDADAVWAFAQGTAEMGRTICTAFGKMTWEAGWLLVPLSQCSRMGERVDGGTLALRDAGEGRILARVASGEVSLAACPPPG
jgi:hypothetical protein